MNSLQLALNELSNLEHGDAEDLAALEEVLDVLVTALEEHEFIEDVFDLGDAFSTLSKKNKVDKVDVAAAKLLVHLAHEVRYGEFPEKSVKQARKACGTVVAALEEILT